MKVIKANDDFFGSEFRTDNKCYECGKLTKQGWESAMELPAGRITIFTCNECFDKQPCTNGPMDKGEL